MEKGARGRGGWCGGMGRGGSRAGYKYGKRGWWEGEGGWVVLFFLVGGVWGGGMGMELSELGVDGGCGSSAGERCEGCKVLAG